MASFGEIPRRALGTQIGKISADAIITPAVRRITMVGASVRRNFGRVRIVSTI